ncbi:MAG: hypothetical protein ACOCUL_01295 [Bacteroidota bacterium]
MQVKKPIILYLPGLFVSQLEQELKTNPPKWNYQKEYFYYLSHYLIVKQIQQEKEKFFSLNTKKMKRTILWNIDNYVRYLVNGELLKRDFYINGSKAYHYKINPILLDGFRAVQINPHTKLFHKIINQQRNKQKHYNDADRRPFFLRKMWQSFKKLDFDYDAARNWIELQADSNKKHSYYSALQLMEDKRFRYFKRNKTNFRLDTNLTNLKKELRQFLIGDFVQIDLANSQPFLLSQVLNQIFNSINNTNTKAIPLCCSYFGIDIVQYFGFQSFKPLFKFPQNDAFYKSGELLDFMKTCESGRFYDNFLNRLDNMTRKEVKDMIYRVFYSQNVVYEGFKKTVPFKKKKEQFAKMYPYIYEIIYLLKQKNYANLSVLLQRIESKVFIDTICPKLVDLGIVPITIHDSVIIEKKHLETALNVCKNVFYEVFEVMPTFHVESLKKI